MSIGANLLLQNNTANDHAGGRIEGCQVNVTIGAGARFLDNQVPSSGGNGGGGLRVGNTDALLFQGPPVFRDNRAKFGGCIFIDNLKLLEVPSGSLFINNTATDQGGCICAFGTNRVVMGRCARCSGCLDCMLGCLLRVGSPPSTH